MDEQVGDDLEILLQLMELQLLCYEEEEYVHIDGMFQVQENLRSCVMLLLAVLVQMVWYIMLLSLQN